MVKQKYRLAVFIVVYRRTKNFFGNKKIKYLLLKRKKHWVGWEFPKGGVDKGESPRETAIRETKEECGQEGFDFKIDAVAAEVAGRKVVSCTLRPRPKASPISEDINQINKWLEEQPDIMTINRKREYNDIKELLAKWLNPEAEGEQETPAAPVAPTESAPAAQSDWVNDNQVTEQERASFTLNTSSSDKFDELFQ
jgi:ADP-ribose pyrophosphatase YjhB (NUDIX family)